MSSEKNFVRNSKRSNHDKMNIVINRINNLIMLHNTVNYSAIIILMRKSSEASGKCNTANTNMQIFSVIIYSKVRGYVTHNKCCAHVNCIIHTLYSNKHADVFNQ